MTTRWWRCCPLWLGFWSSFLGLWLGRGFLLWCLLGDRLGFWSGFFGNWFRLGGWFFSSGFWFGFSRRLGLRLRLWFGLWLRRWFRLRLCLW